MPLFGPAFYEVVERGEYEEGDDGGEEESVDYDCGQRPLDIAADAGGNGGREEAKHGYRGCEQYGTHAVRGAFGNGMPQVVAPLSQVVDMRYHDDSVLNGYTDKGYESYCRGDVERHAAHIKGQHATKQCQRHDKHEQACLPHFAEGEDEQDEHDHEDYGYDQSQAVECAVAVFELTGPME